MKRKLFAILVCAATIGATATLALADHQIGGYYRVQGISEYNILSDDGQPDTFVDQRLRMKWTNTLNEFVSVVWFGEVDTVWGERSKGNIGGGGKVGADGVNIETKNAFVDIKIPNTPVSTRIGIQGIGDMGMQSAYFNDDMAAATFLVNVGAVKLTAFWSKQDEGSRSDYSGNSNGGNVTIVCVDADKDGICEAYDELQNPDRDSEDDADLYGVQAGFAATDALKFGAELYWLNVNASGVEASTQDIYTLAVSADMKFGMVGVDGFIGYQLGEAGTTDIAAMVASVNAAAKLGPADVALRVIYYGNDDDLEDDMSFNGGGGAYEFYKEGLQIFLTDMNYNNGNGGRRALNDAAYAGYGLLGVVAKAGATFGQFTVNGALGYFQAIDDERNDEGAASREGTSLGYELSANCSMKVADAATLSLRGAYAILGDFYDAPAGGNDPDDLYKVALMVNVPY